VPGLGKAGYPRAMSDKPAPVRPARWWEKVVCSTQGHNLIGVGFSWQICRTCAQPVGWLDLTGFLAVTRFAAVSLTLGLVLRRLANRRPRRT
jgi:hypothetical protein